VKRISGLPNLGFHEPDPEQACGRKLLVKPDPGQACPIWDFMKQIQDRVAHFGIL
jgi:hypothetical protein